MVKEVEYELTYLAKYLPAGLENCEHKEMIDIYIPLSERHPTLRIRKSGSKYTITKKAPLSEGDSSEMEEQTIPLTEQEFHALSSLTGKRVSKARYLYKHGGNQAELDLFKGDLEGLVLVDFEFKDSEEKNRFKMPEFCLADVTQEEFIAGGMLCGKKYSDIEKQLERFKYIKLSINE